MHFPFFTNRESSFEGQNRGSVDYTNHPILAIATLVQSNYRVLSRKNTIFNQIKHVNKSTGSQTYSSREQNLKIGTAENFRESLAIEVISESLKAYRTLRGQVLTLFTITFWRKWVGWHGEQKINTHACYINFVLDFLEHLTEQKLAYSTINSHRSVKSAYYDLVDNMPISQQPKVCKEFLKGILLNQNMHPFGILNKFQLKLNTE